MKSYVLLPDWITWILLILSVIAGVRHGFGGQTGPALGEICFLMLLSLLVKADRELRWFHMVLNNALSGEFEDDERE